MKHFIGPVIMVSCLIGCSQPQSKPVESSATVATPQEEPVKYAYTIEHPDNWERGSLKNVEVALNALKEFENGNIPASVQNFGDTVKLEMDKFEATLGRDSLQAMFTKERGALKAVKIDMEDWESVISKDKQTEYVSLWYKQTITDGSGKVDSVECMDDLRMKNGKIVLLNEKIRQYPAKK